MKFRFVVYIALVIAVIGFFITRRYYQAKKPVSDVTAKYLVTPGDLFYFRAEDNQFVLLSLGKARHVCPSPSGNLEALGYAEKITLSHRTGKMMMENNMFAESDSPVNRVAFSKDETMLISGAENGIVQFWKIQDKQSLMQLQMNAPVLDLAVSPAGDRIVVGVAANNSGTPDTVQLWGISGNYLSGWGVASAMAVAFSPKGDRVAVGFADGTIQMDREKWETPSPVTTIAWNPAGTLLASGHADKRVRVWDVNTRTLVNEFGLAAPVEPPVPPEKAAGIQVNLISPLSKNDPPPSKGTELVLFDLNGGQLAASFSDGNIRMWKLPTAAK